MALGFTQPPLPGAEPAREMAGADIGRGGISRHVVVALLLALATPVAPLDAVELLELPEYARVFYRGDYPKAKALATERLKARPADVQAQIVLARTEAALGRFDLAYSGFREALRLDPRSPDALYYLAVTAGALAQVEYDRLLAQAPESARAHQLLGETHEAQGRTTEAEAEYKAALAAGPVSVDVLLALGDLARSDLAQTRERFEEAREYYSRALERAPANYDALYGLGACDAYSGHHARAIELFRRALKEEPDSAPARLALGISLLETGQTNAAVTELEAAARLEPKMRQAYYHLARAYHELGRAGDVEQAVARFRELTREEQQANEALIEEREASPRR